MSKRELMYFYDYLDSDMEKQAFLGALKAGLKSVKSLKSLKSTNTGKMFKNIQKSFKDKGIKGGIDTARKYKNPETNLAKGAPKKVTLPKEQQMEATLGRGIRSMTGNFADNLYHLTKGVSIDKPLGKNLKNLGTNLKNIPGRQLRGGQFVEKNLKGNNVYTKGNKKYLKSKSRFLKDREVIQDTGRGAIVKKRMLARAASPVTSPGVASVGVGSFGAQHLTDPKKPIGKKIKQSLKDSSRFLLGDAAGVASYLVI